MLGKRSKSDPKKEEDNPVTQVDFIEIDKIKTSSKPSRQQSDHPPPDRDTLPQSVRERYQTSKINKREDKHNFKKDEERKRESTTSALSGDSSGTGAK